MYRSQITALEYPPELIRLYLGEGDSVDNTWGELNDWYLDAPKGQIVLINRDTGRPRLFHTPRAERMKTLSITGNAVWRRIAEDGWGDYALMLESDLLFPPDTLARLVERMPEDAAAMAPMVWISVNEHLRFYDIWAFRQGGNMLPAYPPAWFLERFGDEPFELDSVGSVVLFKMDYIKQGARLCQKEAIVGMCKQIRGMGGKIYADPDTHIIHPMVEGVR